MRRSPLVLAALALAASAGLTSLPAHGAPAKPGFATVKLAGANGGTEPRVAVGPDGKSWVVTNAKTGGTAVVYGSTDGKRWTKTASDFQGQQDATIDTDIVVTRTGRIIASELDFTGIRFVTAYSDDGGKTWTESLGMPPADSDRQWLATGPDDPTTHQPRVYLLWHNLGSGSVTHNMWVQTSTDNGATFGPPVPTTVPGDEAFGDLQCADSGGPSGIAVDQKTGRVYVAFGTRSGPALGGCTASVVGPFEINVVNATRVWVASSPDGSLGSWRPVLAVDRSSVAQETEQIVGMQLSPIAVDREGYVYVSFPESRSTEDFTAAAKYVWSAPGGAKFSKAVTVSPLAGAGNVLVHVTAGDKGRLGFAYMRGELRDGGKPQWYSMYSVTADGLSSAPSFSTVRLSPVPTYAGTANALMGSCGTGPAKGVQNGFACSRSSDVYGIATDKRGYAVVTWPAVSGAGDGADAGTYVATQLIGPSLFVGSSGTGSTRKPPAAFGGGAGSSGSGSGSSSNGGLATTGGPAGVGALALALLLGGMVARRRRASES